MGIGLLGCADDHSASSSGGDEPTVLTPKANNEEFDPDAGSGVSITIEWETPDKDVTEPDPEPRSDVAPIADTSENAEDVVSDSIEAEDAKDIIGIEDTEPNDASDAEGDGESLGDATIWSPGSCCETQSGQTGFHSCLLYTSDAADE